MPVGPEHTFTRTFTYLISKYISVYTVPIYNTAIVRQVGFLRVLHDPYTRTRLLEPTRTICISCNTYFVNYIKFNQNRIILV